MFQAVIKYLITYETQMKSFCPTVFVLHELWKGEFSVSIRLFSTMFYVLVFNHKFP